MAIDTGFLVGALMKARYKQCLSQLDVAKMMGVSTGVISKIESRMQAPSIDQLNDYAAVVGIEIQTIVIPASTIRTNGP